MSQTFAWIDHRGFLGYIKDKGKRAQYKMLVVDYF
jgi:hypothetical protein